MGGDALKIGDIITVRMLGKDRHFRIVADDERDPNLGFYAGHGIVKHYPEEEDPDSDLFD